MCRIPSAMYVFPPHNCSSATLSPTNPCFLLGSASRSHVPKIGYTWGPLGGFVFCFTLGDSIGMGCNGDVGIFKAPQVILSVQFETTGLDQCFSHLKGHRSHLDILLTCTHVQPVSDAISSSAVPFSSFPQSLPASGSFTMSQLFA